MAESFKFTKLDESIDIGTAILYKILLLVLQYVFENCIRIGIGNTFCRVYWYCYCQYFLEVLLTSDIPDCKGLCVKSPTTYRSKSLRVRVPDARGQDRSLCN